MAKQTAKQAAKAMAAPVRTIDDIVAEAVAKALAGNTAPVAAKAPAAATKATVAVTAANGKHAVVSQRSGDRDLHEGGRWVPTVIGLVYADCEPGDAVEMHAKDGSVRTVVVEHVIRKGISAENGQGKGAPFTKFLPVAEPRAEKVKRQRGVSASQQMLSELAAMRADIDALRRDEVTAKRRK